MTAPRPSSFPPPPPLSESAFADPEAPAVGAVSRLLGRLALEPLLAAWSFTRVHPLIALARRDKTAVLLAPARLWDKGRALLHPFVSPLASGQLSLLLVGPSVSSDTERLAALGVAALLPAEPGSAQVLVALDNAHARMEARARADVRGEWLNRYRYELGEFIEISKAITTEREVDRLLGLILEKARFITGADAGSLYVVEGESPDPTERSLRFKLSQNDSVNFDSKEFSVPISASSMSGYVALHKRPLRIDDVYALPPEAPFGFDRRFDERIRYRTRSMLCAPLLARGGEVIGVLQLINKKRDPRTRLKSPEDAAELVVPFDDWSEELLGSLASQAGIALENAILNEEIRRMLEGFVRASVEAIEQRDPTTSGHSRRVAELSLSLARAVERSGLPAFEGVSWSRDDLRELEYASLLHDFGKIGVREEVLVKAKKLYPHELEQIRARFELALRSVEVDVLQRKLRVLREGGPASTLDDLDTELALRKAELETGLGAVLAANEPTVLKGGDFATIQELGCRCYSDAQGQSRPLLLPSEVEALSLPKGTLTPRELLEIQSHVQHTVGFLSKIPWGKQFKQVARIAGAHHERLNGSGYPSRLPAAEIPLQSKIMSVSDIFDALTASDRPYKRAVPVEKALDILGFEVKDQHLDADLVRVFGESRAWSGILSEG